MAQDRDIKYVNREFGDFKNQLIEYAKNYFPDSYNDFSPASPGMMFIEMAAYVGDVLAFYQDTQLQETYIQYTKNPGNLYNLAYMMGYRPKVSTISEVDIEVYCTLPVLPNSNGQPDWSKAPSIPPGTVLEAVTADRPRFIIDHPIDFAFSSSLNPTAIVISQLDPITFQPLEFGVLKKFKAYSGEIKEVTENIGGVEKFKTIIIEDDDIIGIHSIEDSEENIWYEVPYLGQDTIYEDTANTSTDKGVVPYVLSLQKVPRRFVSRFLSTRELQVQFGSGIAAEQDSIITPVPDTIGVGATPYNSTLRYAYDPSNFLSTQTYGLAPSNTALRIRYIVGGGIPSNVPANSINTVVELPELIGDTSRQSTLTFNNTTPATGGKDGDSIEELRENSMRAFNEQGRVVTLQDYLVRALSLPAKYGTVSKVHIIQDQLNNPNKRTDSIIDSNPLSLSIYTLSYDSNKNLISTTPNLRNNLQTYLSQYTMLTDAINIRDAFVINIEVTFDVIIRPNFTAKDVLLACTARLKDYFSIVKWGINQPINLSNIYTLLDKEKGVQTVQKVQVMNKVGGDYSQYAYDIVAATRNNVVYPSYDPMIFEVKYLDRDIKGRITTL